MDPRAPGFAQGLAGYLDVFFYGSAQPTNHGVFDDGGNFGNRFKIARTGDRKSSLNDIHAQKFQLQSDLHLFVGIELAAGHLFTVPEGGIKNINPVRSHTLLGLEKKIAGCELRIACHG